MKRTRWRVITRIKSHITDARTVAEVNAVAVHYARHVTALGKSRRRHEKDMAIQIRNLARYQRLIITYH